MAGPIDFRFGHGNKRVKADIDLPIVLSIDVQHIQAWHNPAEEVRAIVIALHIVDAIVLPFIAVALDVHVSFSLCVPHIRPEVGSAYLLLASVSG